MLGEITRMIHVAGSKIHVSNLPDIMKLVTDLWTPANASVRTVILPLLALICTLAEAFGISMRGVLCKFEHNFKQSLFGDSSTDKIIAVRILRCFIVLIEKLGSLDGFLLIYIADIISYLYKDARVSTNVRLEVVAFLIIINNENIVRQVSSHLVMAIAHVLDSENCVLELRNESFRLLNQVTILLGHDFATNGYVSLISEVLKRNNLYDRTYDRFIRGIISDYFVPKNTNIVSLSESFEEIQNTTDGDMATVFPVDQNVLKAAWEFTENKALSEENWVEWIKRFNKALLRESSSPALRACASIAEVYQPLARELFNAAFVSCWDEIYEEFQEEFVLSLERNALTDSSPSSLETKMLILNLAEFMNFMDKGNLPVTETILARTARSVRAHAKALHYKERLFYVLNPVDPHLLYSNCRSLIKTGTLPFVDGRLVFRCSEKDEPCTEEKRSEEISRTLLVVAALIEINNELHLPDAAAGVLSGIFIEAGFAEDMSLRLQALTPSLHEKLGKWQQALDGYTQLEIPLNQPKELYTCIMGQMRCLDALGMWHELLLLVESKWMDTSSDGLLLFQKEDVAQLACSAAVGAGQWNKIGSFIATCNPTSSVTYFYKAVSCIFISRFYDAYTWIGKAREEATTFMSINESYDRSLNNVMNMQLLVEVDEIIKYKIAEDGCATRAAIRQTWRKRLIGSGNSIDVWHRILKLRALVLNPIDDVIVYTEFSDLCLKKNQIPLAKSTLVNLIGFEPTDDSDLSGVHPLVVFSYAKYLWSTKQYSNAFVRLEALLVVLQKAPPESRDNIFISQCNLQIATLLFNQSFLPTEGAVSKILQHSWAAVEHFPSWQKAWNTWGLINFTVLQKWLPIGDNTVAANGPDVATRMSPAMVDLAINALKGFFKAISLGSDNSLQDALRILHIWFVYAGHKAVFAVLDEGLSTIHIDTWLQVIPHFFARIELADASIKSSIHTVILNIGRQHPQAMVLPLIVALKSGVPERVAIASRLLNEMRQHSGVLVDENMLLTEELIRASVLWHEVCHVSLQEASRLFWEHRNIPGMVLLLNNLHKSISRPETPHEIAFLQTFKSELEAAHTWCTRWETTKDERDICAGWDGYHSVFLRIARMLAVLTPINLQYVSPRLFQAKNLTVTVPGKYKVYLFY